VTCSFRVGAAEVGSTATGELVIITLDVGVGGLVVAEERTGEGVVKSEQARTTPKMKHNAKAEPVFTIR
jgi:hypothetical protein